MTHKEVKDNECIVGRIFGCWEVINFVGSRCSPKNRLSRIWLAKCTNCGKEAKKDTTKLGKNRRCKHCCLKPKGESGLKKLFRRYKKTSSRLNREFDLTIHQFQRLTSGSCFYCGCEPSKRHSTHDIKRETWGDYKYNGIDRKDNNLGYTFDNCVTCCYICNRAKNNLTFEEFCDYLDGMVKFRTS